MHQLFGGTVQQITQSPDIGQPGSRIRPRRFEKNVVRLVFA